MTPQEQQLVNELFARLAQLEGAPRDPEAEHLIADGMKKAPNASYALVQTTLVQDEALKRANSRIQELEAQRSDVGQSQRQQSGFLDSMRNALFGSNEPDAPVSTVRPQAAQSGSAGTPGAEPNPGYSAPRTTSGIAAQPYSPAGPTLGSGGSFLGTAAAAAAGVVGGGLLRSMFGHRSGSAESDRVASGGHSQDAAPRESNLDDNDLARQGGIDDVDQNYIDQDQNDTEDDGIFGDDDTYVDDDTDDA
jgi:hypothetical protein